MDTPVKHIKGYDLGERIGAGGFGAVFKAYQTTVGRDVAIKFILPGLANQPDFIRRFESEAQLVARLEHPHITPLYDYWRDPEGAYLVMRWLRGGSLRDSLQNGAFELRATALLLDQIAGALSLAHRNGVIHRDIKPGNILLDEDGNAYLTDFGIAKDLNLPTNHTQQDTIVGSLDYISPEQARSEPVTPRTDIYSLGVTLYEIITGHHPFEHMSSIERLYKHINDPLPEIDTIESQVQEEVNRVIQKATAKNPEHRYPDALALAADFREAIGMNRSSTTIEELLTRREHEILQMIIDGQSNKEIAQHLTVALGTIKWHVNQIYSKLGVRSRVQAIIRARDLNLIVKFGEAPASVPIPTEDFHPQNPYKGLLAFQAADSQDFFGREQVTSKLVKRLQESGEFNRFLAIVGPSGSGKSSLVKAGLIPALWRGELAGSEKWFIAEMLPGSHPLDELEVALTRIAANQNTNLNEQLRRDNRGLLRIAGLILPNDGSELVLIIDQFEEVFTLLEDETERIHFLELLYVAVTEARGRVRVIITLRADFYDRPLHYPQFGELVRTRLETIMPLSAEELENAIARPAERVGVVFEPGLVSAIIADVNYQPGALPLLQYALTELFEQRQGRLLTRDAYQSIGGTVGALAKTAESVYLQMSPAEQLLSHQLFLRLVTLGEETEDTRRRTDRSELQAIAADSDMIDEIIDTLASYRLLSLDTNPATRQPTVEVAHEALLREWERLRTWLNESRDEIKTQRQLSAMAIEWDKSGQEVSFLVRGARLNQFAKWSSETQLALTHKERLYLNASLTAHDQQKNTEIEQQVREQQLEHRSQKFLRWLVVVLAVATLGAFGLTGIAVSKANEADNARNISDINLRQSNALRFAAESNQIILQNGDSSLSALLAISSLNTIYTPQGDRAIMASLSLDYPIQQFIGHADRIKAIDYAPDGRFVLTGSGDSTVRLWDVATGQEIRQFAADMEDINSAVFSPDGQQILTGSRFDHTVRVWDVATGLELQRFSEGNSGAFSLDGTKIFIYSEETLTSQMIDLASGEVLHTISNQISRRPEVTGYSPDGSLYVASSPDDPLLHLTNTQSEEVVFNLPLPEIYNSFAISDNNQYFMINDNTSILVYDIAQQVLLHTLVGHTDVPASFVFSRDNHMIASGGNDRAVIVWDIETGEAIQGFTGHNQAVRKVAFSPDGLYVLSGSFDQRALLWEINPASGIPELKAENENVWFTTYSPDRRQVIAGRSDGQMMVWDAQTQTLQQSIQADEDAVWFAGFAGDTGMLVSGASIVRIWSEDSGELEYELAVPDGLRQVNTTDSNIIITMHDPDENWTGGVILWDVTTGKELQRFETSFAPDYSILSSDGAYLATYSLGDNMLRLIDITRGEEVYQWEILNRIDSAGIPFAFSPDGHHIFLGDGSGTGWLRDVATGESVQTFIGHFDRVSDVGFSSDGNRIATTSSDGTIRLWDVASGHEIRRMTLPFVPLSADFSADDSTLLVLGNDEQIRLFYTDILDSIHYLCSRVSRDFSSVERSLYVIADDQVTCN